MRIDNTKLEIIVETQHPEKGRGFRAVKFENGELDRIDSSFREKLKFFLEKRIQ